MLVAHLSCRAVTVNATHGGHYFCRKCGKKLTEKNTVAVDQSKLPEEVVHAILREACFATYDNLEEVKAG